MDNFVFSKGWFKKYQKLLLRFANSWLGRKILCIDGKKSSIGKNKIDEIGPNYIRWKNTWEFRTHNKFGKRLYYAFKPLWHLAHYWDIAIANNLKPALNLGFDTFTSYPNDDPELTSVDGWVRRAAAVDTFSNLRAGAGTTSDDNDASFLAVYVDNVNGTDSGWDDLIRSIYLFDTSAIQDGASITAATFSLYVNSKRDIFAQDVGLVGSTPASNTALVASDYGQLGTTRYATDLDVGALTTSAYNDWTLNATGLAAISVTSTPTKFGVRYSGDIDNSAPTASTDYAEVNVNFADTAGTTSDPKLVVTGTSLTTTSTSTS